MNVHEQYPALGAAIEGAYRDALEDWLRYHRKGRDLETVLANDVKSVQVSAALKPFGRSYIVISIIARKHHDSASYPFDLQTTPFSAYNPPQLG